MKQKYTIFIVIGVGVVLYLYVFFNFMFLSLNKKISKLKQDITEKEKKLQEAYSLVDSLPILQQETKLLEKELEELERKVPKEIALPLLIKIISKRSEIFNVRINSIRPLEVDTSSPKFNEVPLEISFQTSFHSLGQFLTDIAQTERIISGKNIVLSYTGDKKFPLTGNCILVGYSLK